AGMRTDDVRSRSFRVSDVSEEMLAWRQEDSLNEHHERQQDDSSLEGRTTSARRRPADSEGVSSALRGLSRRQQVRADRRSRLHGIASQTVARNETSESRSCNLSVRQ